ncbi:MAG: 23S rRNA (pseudouridine(1915)-N(3))-methyltransferase RlmH [Alphaproteobacteria bacterium]|nr:MAG: 23S rRNA (pseudouridine(1915)-N(3))-methyltransferase RlmH [Alphaproteobacteria bacterium]
MRITIIAVGRLKSGPETSLMDGYLKRLPWPVNIVEVDERRPIKGPERQAREAELILGALPDGAMTIALDEQGKTYDSPGFAAALAHWRQHRSDHLAFLIGGADGFAPEIKSRADHKVSLGAMTWPHALARVMLVEQLYRAHTILSGHPYHK